MSARGQSQHKLALASTGALDGTSPSFRPRQLMVTVSTGGDLYTASKPLSRTGRCSCPAEVYTLTQPCSLVVQARQP